MKVYVYLFYTRLIDSCSDWYLECICATKEIAEKQKLNFLAKDPQNKNFYKVKIEVKNIIIK